MPQFDSNMFNNPQMGNQGGGMPQGVPQGPPMGGGMPGMGGPQQPMMGQPMGGGGQPRPGMGGPPQPTFATGNIAGRQQGGAQRERLQGEIDQIQQQLTQAQISGANPQVIAQLQAQLQGAQRAYQEAGMQAMFSMQQGRPQPGPRGLSSRGGGGAPSQYDAQRMDSWQNQMQLLMGLWGLGGGGGPGGGG